jgi:soluble cytochrome b562|tara:strand:+ start:63 stop:614 length:552 start_codon:yes stop_codon:yes gene_type:complete
MIELTKKLADVQTKLKAKKSSYNSFGKYYFRKAEDILEGVKPFLLQHNIYVTVSEDLIATDPVPMIKTTATISDGKDAIHATAVVGVDMQQKGMQTAQQFGAASTYAKKYALGNLFLIDDTEDADATNQHGKGVAAKVAAKTKPAITKEQMTKAVEFIKGGGDVNAIKNKYKLTSAQEKQLVK